MNSWKSTELSAWAPPLSTFIIGTGSSSARRRRRARPDSGRAAARESAAAALAAASETPSSALAPSRPLFGVPSSSIIVRSSAPCSAARAPVRAAAISPLTLATARPTPLPAQRSPPSRSSTASNSPGRGARGNRREATCARLQHDLHLDGGVAARVEDLARVDRGNRAHGRASLISGSGGLRCAIRRFRREALRLRALRRAAVPWHSSPPAEASGSGRCGNGSPFGFVSVTEPGQRRGDRRHRRGAFGRPAFSDRLRSRRASALAGCPSPLKLEHCSITKPSAQTVRCVHLVCAVGDEFGEEFLLCFLAQGRSRSGLSLRPGF